MELAYKKDTLNFGDISDELTLELNSRLESVLNEYSIIRGTVSSIHSLHGVIGMHKAVYLDLVKGSWSTHEDYIADWLRGLKDMVASGRRSSMYEIFKNPVIREYIFLFLERDFYKHYEIRVKQKPQENLWSIWFGNETLFWGLLIAPRFYDSGWVNKPARVRKVEFGYWTIGHVLKTGLVDPENGKIYEFRSLDELLIFYESILKRVSNSIYEKPIYDFYGDYVKASKNPLSEPFLIPEFRYDGIAQKHKYRLDFTILNCYTGERIGFELSPQSTHMAVSGITTKTQVQMNQGLSKRWNHEMQKRNEYFQQYGITTITFTDEQLVDINKCFEVVKYYLSKRNPEKKSIQQLVDEIIKIEV